MSQLIEVLSCKLNEACARLSDVPRYDIYCGFIRKLMQTLINMRRAVNMQKIIRLSGIFVVAFMSFRALDVDETSVYRFNFITFM